MFGSGPNQRGHGDIDLEAMEQENDRNIAALGERIGMLRNITSGIHTEVESQHRLLDSMSQGFAGIQMGLGASVNKFKRVMNEPQGRRMVLTAAGAAVLLFLLYIWWK